MFIFTYWCNQSVLINISSSFPSFPEIFLEGNINIYMQFLNAGNVSRHIHFHNSDKKHISHEGLESILILMLEFGFFPLRGK